MRLTLGKTEQRKQNFFLFKKSWIKENAKTKKKLREWFVSYTFAHGDVRFALHTLLHLSPPSESHSRWNVGGIGNWEWDCCYCSLFDFGYSRQQLQASTTSLICLLHYYLKLWPKSIFNHAFLHSCRRECHVCLTQYGFAVLRINGLRNSQTSLNNMSGL